MRLRILEVLKFGFVALLLASACVANAFPIGSLPPPH
jgi:hypothetical protein